MSSAPSADEFATANDAKTVFAKAQEIEATPMRAAYVAEACGGDEALRAEVERLLAAADEAGEFMNRPAVATIHFEPSPAGSLGDNDHRVTEGPGTTIGPYKLMEQIGEGGFGLVFVAEQHRPVRRKVALKIIKPGMDTAACVARFEAERQALALMDHPNIAKVFDAGATESGRPYFVMELVRGVPITEFCDQRHLTPRERLALFVSVCHAIQHAHQKGIIHRDVKPTNVMVTLHDNVPVVKVIDFGVAKALSHQLTERTIYTQFAQMLGTPLYMSPEQAEMSGLDIDTRSDIYSLGVLLYELLTGTTPFDRERLKKAAALEIRRILCEEEPPKPSTRLTQSGDRLPSIAAQRNTEPARLARLMRGDLDWIAMKCLEKDRNRRYETANDLARDVERYLRNEPIEACPPSVGYRLRKFAKRNKRMLATAALFSVLLLTTLATVAGSIGWVARDRAARHVAVEREISLALQEVQPAYERDALPDAIAAVKKAEALLASGPQQPQLQRRVEGWKNDLRLVERLEEIRLDRADQQSLLLNDYSPSTVDAYLTALQDFGLKLVPHERLVDMYDIADAGSSPLKPRRLKTVDVSQIADTIRSSPIKPHLVAAIDDWAAQSSDHDRRLLFAIAREVDDNTWRNRLRKAIEQNDMESLKNLAQDEELVTQPATSVGILARKLLHEETLELAINVLRRAQRRHPSDFWTNLDLAQMLLVSGTDGHDAVSFARVALALRPKSHAVRDVLGEALDRSGNLADAETEFREAIELKPDYMNGYIHLVFNLIRQQKWEDAISVYEKAIQSVPVPRREGMYFYLGRIVEDAPSDKLGDTRRVVKLAREAVQLAPKDRTATDTLGIALFRTGDWQASISAFEKSITLVEMDPLPQSIDPKRWLYIAMAEWHLGNKDKACEVYDKASEWIEQNRYFDNEALTSLWNEAAKLLGLIDDDGNA